MNINTYNSRIHCSILVNIMLLKKVLYCYDYMYRTLADPKPLRRLPHRRAVLYNIICNLHGSLFNIIFQKNPPANIVFTMYAGVSEVMPTYLRLLQISVCIPVPKSLKKSTLFVNIKKHNIIKCIRR